MRDCMTFIFQPFSVLSLLLPLLPLELIKADWCSYHFSLLFMSYLQQTFQWTNLAILSCLPLYSFCANILHSLIECHSLFHPFGLILILQSGEATDFYSQRLFLSCKNKYLVSTFKSFFLVDSQVLYHTLELQLPLCLSRHDFILSNINFSLCLCSFENRSFISFSLKWSVSSMPKYLYPLSSISLIICTSGSTTPSILTILPRFSTSNPYVCAKCMDCLHKQVNMFIGFPKKF